jgi:hypothetical protein
VKVRLRLRLAAVLSAGLLVAGCGGSSKSESTASSAASAPAGPTATGAPATSTPTSSTATTPATASSSTTASVVSGSADGISATLHASTHQPRVNRPWPLHFLVTSGGRPVRASVSYEYLFGGQVVARRSHYTFDGRFSDVFMWPSSAVGYPLTFRAVIVVGKTLINLDYPVQVTR